MKQSRHETAIIFRSLLFFRLTFIPFLRLQPTLSLHGGSSVSISLGNQALLDLTIKSDLRSTYLIWHVLFMPDALPGTGPVYPIGPRNAICTGLRIPYVWVSQPGVQNLTQGHFGHIDMKR